jgi:hypothetical protein
MRGPRGLYLLIAGKFASGRCSFRLVDCLALVGRELHGCNVFVVGKLKHNAGNIVLLVGIEDPHGLQRLLQEFCHNDNIVDVGL